MPNVSINFYPISTRKSDDAKPYIIDIDYFETLKTAIESFKERLGWNIDKVFNIYGQEIPLTYRVQKSNLNVYFNDINQIVKN